MYKVDESLELGHQKALEMYIYISIGGGVTSRLVQGGIISDIRGLGPELFHFRFLLQPPVTLT